MSLSELLEKWRGKHSGFDRTFRMSFTRALQLVNTEKLTAQTVLEMGFSALVRFPNMGEKAAEALLFAARHVVESDRDAVSVVRPFYEFCL